MFQISFRPISRQDFPLLVKWLAAPHVAEWWDDPEDLKSVETMYLPCIDGQDSTRVFVIEVDGEAAGIIQLWRLKDSEEWAVYQTVEAGLENAAGIDFLLGEERHVGKGIGSQAIRDFVSLVFDVYLEIDIVLSDPEQENIASWVALEKAGFERIWAGELESSSGPSFLYRRRRGRQGG
ncbi:MAG: acetyltransferase [SAR202 cluster bacterium]|nr:acetyltransferase [SAR202 cluster bacterium]